MFEHKSAKDEFEVLFKENYNKLYMFTYNFLNDKETSEDIVNDSFEYVWRNYERLKSSSLIPVLFQLAKHKSFNHLRHNKIVEKHAFLLIHTTPEFEDPQEEDDEQRVSQVMMIVNTLPPKTRIVLEECYFNQKKYSEVAQMLNISTSTVKKHIMKALNLLREKLSAMNKES